MINQGTSYAIINIENNKIVAQNISSFFDCVKTLELLVAQQSNPIPVQEIQPIPRSAPRFDVREDVQKLIEKYAPTTVRFEKKYSGTFRNKSRYKCYDASGNCLGRVKGKLGDRYWEDLNGRKHY